METAIVWVIVLVALWAVVRSMIRSFRGRACGACGRRRACGVERGRAVGDAGGDTGSAS